MRASTEGKATMNMMTQRALSEGIPGIPDGTPGVAMQACGHYDPESVEFEAWLFAPEGEPDEAAYYCTREQWIAL